MRWKREKPGGFRGLETSGEQTEPNLCPPEAWLHQTPAQSVDLIQVERIATQQLCYCTLNYSLIPLKSSQGSPISS